MMTKACAVLLFTFAICFAQSKNPSDAWLMQNYRFAPAPAPGEVPAVSPVVGQLQEIQITTMNILHKAEYEGDYEAALAAAAQAAANAQLLGAITGELKPPQPNRQTGPAAAPDAKSEAPLYLIAFRDQTIKAATAVWRDRLMLHYMTREGSHEQVRLDLVDWKFSTELNSKAGSAAAHAPRPSASTSAER